MPTTALRGALLSIVLLLLVIVQKKQHRASAQVCEFRGDCCMEDCCGPGTSWDMSLGICYNDTDAPGWSGEYSPEYGEVCEMLCCEQDCCGAGTFYNYTMACCVPRPDPSPDEPQVAIVDPESGVFSCERDLVVAAELIDVGIDEADVETVAFRYKANDGSSAWNDITESADGSDEMSLSNTLWTARWDATDLTAGTYLLRCVVNLQGGEQLESDDVTVEFGTEPSAFGTASVTNNDGSAMTVDFDGTGSTADPDGTIVAWTWNFGDSEGTEEGSTPTHVYTDLSNSTDFEVTLAVTDDQNCTGSTVFILPYNETGNKTTVEKKYCKCTGIELRGDDPAEEPIALGPDAKTGGTTWPPWQSDDGKTLGPLNDNPGNPSYPVLESIFPLKFRTEKLWTGYHFEVVATVQGNPDDCEEIQLIKRTVTKADKTTVDKTWTPTNGKGDLDLDGVDDIDVSTEEKCTAAGGTWSGGKCTLTYPQSGAAYGVDGYASPYNYKKHVKVQLQKKVIWSDSPGISAKGYINGARYKADFVAVLRGTDGLYCYMKFGTDSQKLVGKDAETLTFGSAEVGVASLPGVP